jgi:hypothetical protein
MPQGAVGLLLKSRGEFWVSFLIVQEGPESRLNSLSKSEWCARDHIGTLLQEESDDLRIPPAKNIRQIDGSNIGSVRDQEFDDIHASLLDRVIKSLVLCRLRVLVADQQLDQTVKSKIDGYCQRSLSRLRRGPNGFSYRDPFFDVVKSSCPAEPH